MPANHKFVGFIVLYRQKRFIDSKIFIYKKRRNDSNYKMVSGKICLFQ